MDSQTPTTLAPTAVFDPILVAINLEFAKSWPALTHPLQVKSFKEYRACASAKTLKDIEGRLWALYEILHGAEVDCKAGRMSAAGYWAVYSVYEPLMEALKKLASSLHEALAGLSEEVAAQLSTYTGSALNRKDRRALEGKGTPGVIPPSKTEPKLQVSTPLGAVSTPLGAVSTPASTPPQTPRPVAKAAPPATPTSVGRPGARGVQTQAQASTVKFYRQRR